MIAPLLLTKEQVKEQLEAFGCHKADDSIEGHSCWMTPWDLAFFVPELPPDGMTAEWTLGEILADIEKSAPKVN